MFHVATRVGKFLYELECNKSGIDVSVAEVIFKGTVGEWNKNSLYIEHKTHQYFHKKVL
jgi:hypothetical protein